MNTWTTPAGANYPFYDDLLSQKHLLIAGATGSGKSVLLNGIIYQALYSFPGEKKGNKKFIFIDQKGMELIEYRDLPHTLRYATRTEETIAALEYAVEIIERRNEISAANRTKVFSGGDVYVIIDEFADVMTTCGKRATPLIQRIAQIGRAARVHIILCTQTPKADIIPTKISCNFDTRIGLGVATAQQSRLILGCAGCENLPEYGEGLYISPKHRKPVNICNIPYFTEEELSNRAEWWIDQVQEPEKKPGFFKRLFKCA